MADDASRQVGDRLQRARRATTLNVLLAKDGRRRARQVPNRISLDIGTDLNPIILAEDQSLCGSLQWLDDDRGLGPSVTTRAWARIQL